MGYLCKLMYVIRLGIGWRLVQCCIILISPASYIAGSLPIWDVPKYGFL